MSNAWNITESEYRTALERSRDSNTSSQDSADYWQLCRFYRGQIFLRDGAARGARLVRGSEVSRADAIAKAEGRSGTMTAQSDAQHSGSREPK